MPLLLRVDPHDLVAEVLVLAADVGEGVVDVVVGVLPGLGGRGGVPVPGRGVDLRVVHPVPLAVQDVVADLHVLEDLRRRERRRPGDPGRPVAGGEQQHPRRSRRGGAASRSCSRCSGGRGRRARRGRGRGSRRTRRRAPRAARRELGERALRSQSVAGVHRSSFRSVRSQSAISIGPSGALTQVRTISPSLPWTLPVRRSRTCPWQSSPTQVWQMPIRQPKGRVAPASSPATRIGVPPSQLGLDPALDEADRAALAAAGLAADHRLEALHVEQLAGRPPRSQCSLIASSISAGPERKAWRSRQSGQSRRGRPGRSGPARPVSCRCRSIAAVRRRSISSQALGEDHALRARGPSGRGRRRRPRRCGAGCAACS